MLAHKLQTNMCINFFNIFFDNVMISFVFQSNSLRTSPIFLCCNPNEISKNISDNKKFLLKKLFHVSIFITFKNKLANILYSKKKFFAKRNIL
mmetsp:Transcript_52764/g.138811  ORF Transcript_52764/g.138811 Transcript_52764/m.138811 type:complete len:93 (-) Transcript_52764:3666-3944(-)